MTIHTYDDKKSSGVEWLGEIPKHWKVAALKRVLSEPLKYGATEAGDCNDQSLPRYIRITDFDNDGRLRDDTFASLPEDIAHDYYVNEGDILFARSGATVGKTFLFRNHKDRACFAGYLIKASPARHKLSSEFLYYFTKSPAYEAWKDFIFTQATIQNIGADKYAYLPVCLPPLAEQEKIAAYLDASCAVIDAAVAAKRGQVEVLDNLQQLIITKAVTRGVEESISLKDSGIEVLGQIPHHWRQTKLRYEVAIRSGDFASDKLEDDGIYPVIGGNGQMGRTTVYNTDGEIIVVGRVGAHCGNAHYVKGRAWVSDNALIVESNHDKRFLLYLFRALDFNGMARKTAQPLITGTQIKNIYVALPKIEEQIKIVDFVQQQIAHFDELRENLRKQIETLVFYRKSLIHECVTGQRRISEADVNQVKGHG